MKLMKIILLDLQLLDLLLRSNDDFLSKDFKTRFSNYLELEKKMFKKPLQFHIVIFFVLLITTSVVKNKTRNIEKNIQKIN